MFSLALSISIALAGCGGSATSKVDSKFDAINPPSHLLHRAFISLAPQSPAGFNGTIHIVDDEHDLPTTGQIGGIALTDPGIMLVVPNYIGLVYSNNDGNMWVFDPQAEKETGKVPLDGFTESFALSPDYYTGYAAVPTLGVVDVMDLLAYRIIQRVPVLGAHWVALSPDGTNLLVFGDGSDAVTVVKTNTYTTTTVSGFDRPIAAFFTDSTHAIVLSCGAECGGSKASVSMLSFTNNSVSVGPATPVAGATVGLLNGGNLYVAGATTLSVVNTSTLAVSATAAISDGYHQAMGYMGLGTNNTLFIGAKQCSAGCLSMVNLTNNSVVIDAPKGNVTGILPIPFTRSNGSPPNVVYVAEGGHLRIYDPTTDAESTTAGYNFLGVVDIKSPDGVNP